MHWNFIEGCVDTLTFGWIGRRGPIAWRPRSPDLTTLDLSMRVNKRLGVPNEGARCGRTASPNNCSLWDCFTGDAVNTWQRWSIVSTFFGPLRAHTWRSTEERQKVSESLHPSVKFPCVYLSYFRKYIILLLVEILPDTLYFPVQPRNEYISHNRHWGQYALDRSLSVLETWNFAQRWEAGG
jgi:hypothetical protein